MQCGYFPDTKQKKEKESDKITNIEGEECEVHIPQQLLYLAALSLLSLPILFLHSKGSSCGMSPGVHKISSYKVLG